MSLNSGSRTRRDWIEDEFSNILSDDRLDELVQSTIRKENELIWAWYRDPHTDLTQIEARNRAQGPYGTAHEYGRFNVTQSTLSRKLKKLDDSMLTEPILRLKMHLGDQYEDDKDYSGGLLDIPGFEARAKHNPESLDMLRTSLARFLIDMHAIGAFRTPVHKTPEWAQERFPDKDPNMGLHERNSNPEADTSIDPHEPHE